MPGPGPIEAPNYPVELPIADRPPPSVAEYSDVVDHRQDVINLLMTAARVLQSNRSSMPSTTPATNPRKAHRPTAPLTPPSQHISCSSDSDDDDGNGLRVSVARIIPETEDESEDDTGSVDGSPDELLDANGNEFPHVIPESDEETNDFQQHILPLPTPPTFLAQLRRPRNVGRWQFGMPEVLVPPYNNGDQPLTLKPIRNPSTVRIPHLPNVEAFRSFAHHRGIDLQGVNIQDMYEELVRRARILSGDPVELVISPFILTPVNEPYPRELLALFALGSFLIQTDRNTLVTLMFCISRLGVDGIRNLLTKIDRAYIALNH